MKSVPKENPPLKASGYAFKHCWNCVYRYCLDTCPTQSQTICIRIRGLRYSEITLHFPIFHGVTGGIFNHLCMTGHVKAVDNLLNEVAGKHRWLGGLEASQQIHPGRLTWNPKLEVWKMIFPVNLVIFRLHVNFQGCTLFDLLRKSHCLMMMMLASPHSLIPY